MLPFDPAAAPQARSLVCAVLADWGLSDLSVVAELLVSELVTNALIHARGPLHLALEQDGDVAFLVSDGSRTLPQPIAAASDDEHGRGLYILHTLSAAWGVDQHPDGKTVWFELPTAMGP